MKKTILSLLLLPTLALSMTKLDTPYSATAHPELCRRTKNTFSDTEIIVPRSCISSPARLGALSAVADKHGFTVMKDGQETRVHNYDVGPILRKVNKEQLLHLLKNNKLRITQYDNNDYRLELANDLKGGGPITAGIFYGVTKVACYTGAAIGIGCMANSALRRMGAEEGSVEAKVGGSLVGGATAAACGGLPGGAAVAAGAANGGIATDPVLEDKIADGMVGGPSLAFSGGVAVSGAFVGAVETISCFMGAVGMWLPLP